ncbi:MAG: T9SS type A sorting domain-containing protein [Bacteroidota bacterium]
MKTILKHTSFFLLLTLAGNIALAQANCITPDASIWKDTWASCEATPSPNLANGTSHWIQYDLGLVRKLSKTWVWNTNDPNKLTEGFRRVKVDYSLDGRNWTSWGEMEFPQAQGSAIYGGFSGPDLVGVEARYVLLTALSNHGASSCYGLAEVKFNLLPTTFGDYEATACLNLASITDIFIEDVGDTEAYVTWEDSNPAGIFYAAEVRVEGIDWIPLYVNQDEKEIDFLDLLPGTTYEFRIGVLCGNKTLYSDIQKFTTTGIATSNDPLAETGGILSLYPNPAQEQMILEYVHEGGGDISMAIMDLQGRVLEENDRRVQAGVNRISILLDDIPQGIYLLEVISEESGERGVSKFVKI